MEDDFLWGFNHFSSDELGMMNISLRARRQFSAVCIRTSYVVIGATIFPYLSRCFSFVSSGKMDLGNV
jgi:hypothetical protein